MTNTELKNHMESCIEEARLEISETLEFLQGDVDIIEKIAVANDLACFYTALSVLESTRDLMETDEQTGISDN